MNKQNLFLYLMFLFFCTESFSQNFLITDPRLEFDGYKLSITYDIITKENSDIFYVWVEIKNQAGNPIRAFSFKGEVGDSIKPGTNKRIEWIPEEDAIYLDEDISVELKSELYVKAFNKGSALGLSTIVPGLGLTKIKNGKPWWLTSIPAYGALTGSLIVYNSYKKNYDAYLIETEPVERGDLWDKSQQQKSLSGVLFISAAAIWVGNIVWVAATPNRYRPLQHAKLAASSLPLSQTGITLLSFKVDF
ncbi:MAG: hypothetical protein MUC93_02130 [Bacteroidales bacterium]|jgi:hypothetical protein|nr:hypothetical protein [Bacteroidales bacterium]